MERNVFIVLAVMRCQDACLHTCDTQTHTRRDIGVLTFTYYKRNALLYDSMVYAQRMYRIGVAYGKRKAFHHFLQARITPIARKGNGPERFTMLSNADVTFHHR